MSGQTEVRATIIENPLARGAGRFPAEAALHFVRSHGIDARLAVPDSTAAAARESARRGDHLLFVAGGDGTLREAAMGLAGSQTALAVIPAGTANVFAREIGIPRAFRAAIDAHLHGQVVSMDLGRANGKPFLLMASAGWDAGIVRNVRPASKQRLGQGAYALATLRYMPRLRSRTVRFSSGLAHWDVRLGMLVASNTRLYGGLIAPSPGARANDGLLDVCALCPRWPGEGLRLAGRLLFHQLANDVRAVTGRVSELRLETPGVPYQIDGDYAGMSPLTLDVAPRALRVSVPAGPLPAIFQPQE